METALPNLHPALVHFPVVLIPAALSLDLIALVRRDPIFSQLGVLAWWLAAISTAATFVAGRSAADSLVSVPAAAQPAIGLHADWATVSLALCIAVALSRTVLQRARATPGATRGRVAVLLAATALVGVVFITADKGGALVYRHGLAVALPECAECPVTPPAPPAATAGEAAEPLLELVDGDWVWRPSPRHAAALETTPWPSRGVAYAVDGAHVVTFEPVLGDVQVQARVDLSRFDGVLELRHHVNEEGRGALVVDSDGGFRLLDRDTVLGRGAATLTGTHEISVSASGSHLKGLLDGAMVVHGHAPSREPGRVEFVLDGDGIVVVEHLELIPLDPHK